MRGPMVFFVLMALFPFAFITYIVVLAYLTDLTSLPVYLLLPMPPVYLIGLYMFWTKATKSYRERRFKKLMALSFIAFLAFAMPISAVVMAIPNWSFRVITDKTSYRIGENVTITAILTNKALITKDSLDSFCFPFLEIAVSNGSWPTGRMFMNEQYRIDDWFLPVAPGRSLQKTITWSSVNETGVYYVYGDITTTPGSRYRFSDQVNITITP